jgi:hypothetical protein
MKTIWKYELKEKDNQKFEMPAGAEILAVQTQKTIPCIWALVDPEEAREIRSFKTLFTGERIYNYDVPDLKYIGTCQTHEGDLVLHVFENLKTN